MAEISESPIQSELDFFNAFKDYDIFGVISIEFAVDPLVDPTVVRPQDSYEINEI